MEEIIFDKMSIEDLNKISEILYSDFDDFWNYNILKKELENENSYFIVAKIKDEIIGFAGFTKILDEADLTNIVVKKNHRNNGIGNKLLKELIEVASSLNIRCINLEVNELNTYAIKLYQNIGFVTCGLRKKYYYNMQSAILMKYIIKK